MSASCCPPDNKPADEPKWRRALWIALAVNAAMFVVEMGAGLLSGSLALRADALDFFGDAVNYAISLSVAGLALSWRARAALLKGATLVLFGVWIILSALLALRSGTTPHAEVMGVLGVIALLANLAVAFMLFRYREGDANRRSVWICSRNDAIGNVAVVLAAIGVFGTGTHWPDLLVAAIMAGLALWGGGQIIVQAWTELHPRARAVSEQGHA